MNAKTVKLIRRFAIGTGRNYHSAKRAWNLYPKRQRFSARQEMKRNLGRLCPWAN